MSVFENSSGKIAYTIKEACAATGLSRSTLYREHESGRLAMGSLCGRRVIRAVDLDRWFSERFTPGPEARDAA